MKKALANIFCVVALLAASLGICAASPVSEAPITRIDSPLEVMELARHLPSHHPPQLSRNRPVAPPPPDYRPPRSSRIHCTPRRIGGSYRPVHMPGHVFHEPRFGFRR